MRFPSIRVIALLGGLAVAGCGAANIDHGQGGNGGSGGTGGSGGSGGSGGTGGSGGGGSSNNCGVQNFMLTKGGTPDLLIVQDRSGSMAWGADDSMMPPAGQSKWEQIVPAIEQVVQQIATVDWGLMMFANDGMCGAPTTPDVAPAAGTAAAIKAKLDAASPDSSTPTTLAMKNATSYLQGLNDMNAHYILLATDGEPTCGGGGGLGGGGADDANAIQAVTDAATAGINTFVVGIGGNTGADTTLSSMATQGLEPNTTAGQKPYYQVSTTADLVSVLNKVAGQLVSCSYALAMAPANPNYVEIDDNNGVAIPHDTTHMNGWDYGPNDLSIIFYGAACDNLQKGVTTAISAVFGCPPVG